jgi:hypothetical protein
MTGSPAPVLLPCHYENTFWSLYVGMMHRMVFDWSGQQSNELFNGGNTFRSCTFLFTCPASSTGMAVKLTQSVPQGAVLTVRLNASRSTTPQAQFTFLNRFSDVDMVLGRGKGLEVMASGNSGSFAMQATCLTEPHVPMAASEVNSVKNMLPAGGVAALQTFDASFPTYNLPSSRRQYYSLPSSPSSRHRQYGEVEERAFLLSCPTTDMQQDNAVVHLSTISGAVGSAGDVLRVIALDSGIKRTFSGPGTISETLTQNTTTTSSSSTTTTADFAASSQYYVTWSSDAVPEDSEGLTIRYTCGQSQWTVSGVGADVAADGNSGESTSSGATGPLTAALTTITSAILVLRLF